MKKLFFLVAFVFTMGSASQASNYQVNDSQLDALFSSAAQTIMVNLNNNVSELPGMATGFAPAVKEKSALAAILFDFFLGGLGIHRFYLGTKAMTGIGYILTCGGVFGLIPLVDLIVLAVNYDDISDFVDNPKFFMW